MYHDDIFLFSFREFEVIYVCFRCYSDLSDEGIMKEQLERLDRLCDFNAIRPAQMEKRTALLKEMFAEIGDDCYIEPPFYSNFGGGHVYFGKNDFANFHLTLWMIPTFTLAITRCLGRMSQKISHPM